MEELQQVFEISQRRACAVLGQPRSSQRFVSEPRGDEAELVTRMLQLSRERPRFGYRRIASLLRAEGWRASHTRVCRRWRREGLKVPQKKRKRRSLGKAENGCDRHRAESRNHVWAWDFVFDRTTQGSPLKWLSIVDEFTRECLALKVDRSITSEDVIDTLAELFAMYGVPRHIRSDNGPEFVAKSLRGWLERIGVETLYVEPGSPWENGYAESFHSRVRDEFLAVEEFESLSAARSLTCRWREDYNQVRPHSSLGYVAPAMFAARWICQRLQKRESIVTLSDLQHGLKALGRPLGNSARDLLPLLLTIGVFQCVVFRQPLENAGQLLIGLGLVILGLSLFVVGLQMGLFPLGEQMAHDFARKGSLLWLIAFAFALGFGTTFAEPALIAIAGKVAAVMPMDAAVDQQDAFRERYALGLRLTVASAVGIALVMGVLRVILGWPIHYWIMGGYAIVFLLTPFAPREIVAVAYDSGGVTTSTITVPLTTALGVGLASSIKGRSPLSDGFGMIAFASLTPILFVLLWGMLWT